MKQCINLQESLVRHCQIFITNLNRQYTETNTLITQVIVIYMIESQSTHRVDQSGRGWYAHIGCLGMPMWRGRKIWNSVKNHCWFIYLFIYFACSTLCFFRFYYLDSRRTIFALLSLVTIKTWWASLPLKQNINSALHSFRYIWVFILFMKALIPNSTYIFSSYNLWLFYLLSFLPSLICCVCICQPGSAIVFVVTHKHTLNYNELKPDGRDCHVTLLECRFSTQ